MKLAERMSLIKPSATLAVNAKALELKARGIPVISLAVGEPDFPTPDNIRAAAKKAIDEGFTRYTPVGGTAELRRAVAAYFASRNNIELDAKNVIITNGGKQSLYAVMQALLNPGDEVLLPSPYWVSYPEMATMAGAVSVFVPSDADHAFKITPEDLERRRTPKTRMLILNSPSNPTGVCYSRAELDALLEWSFEHDVFVVSDEVYDQLVYAPAVAASVVPWFSRFPEKIAVINAVSKAYSMTGWRVGYTLAAPALIKAMDQMQGQVTSNVCSVSQKAALEALTGPQDSIPVMREAFRRRRDLCLAEIAGWKGVKCPKPDGAFYLFLDMKDVPGGSDDVALCSKLLEEAHVATVPGTSFGAPGCLRISYSTADEVLVEALRRMREVLFA